MKLTTEQQEKAARLSRIKEAINYEIGEMKKQSEPLEITIKEAKERLSEMEDTLADLEYEISVLETAADAVEEVIPKETE